MRVAKPARLRRLAQQDMQLVSQIGESVTNGLAYVGSLASLGGRAAYYTFVGPFQGRPLRVAARGVAGHGRGRPGFADSFADHVFHRIDSGVAEPRTNCAKFGALNLVATAVAISMTRELGPLITAIVVIGRSGSAFAAEIGTMKVTEEIDALETMAISPIHFLVTPKFLAMIVMLPCLTIWANSMGILGGALFGVAASRFHLVAVHPGVD